MTRYKSSSRLVVLLFYAQDLLGTFIRLRGGAGVACYGLALDVAGDTGAKRDGHILIAICNVERRHQLRRGRCFSRLPITHPPQRATAADPIG